MVVFIQQYQDSGKRGCQWSDIIAVQERPVTIVHVIFIVSARLTGCDLT